MSAFVAIFVSVSFLIAWSSLEQMQFIVSAQRQVESTSRCREHAGNQFDGGSLAGNALELSAAI